MTDVRKLRDSYNKSLRIRAQRELYAADIAARLRKNAPVAFGVLKSSYIPSKRDDFRGLFTYVLVDDLGIPVKAEILYNIQVEDKYSRKPFQSDPRAYADFIRGRKPSQRFEQPSMPLGKRVLHWMKIRTKNGGKFTWTRRSGSTSRSYTLKESDIEIAIKGIRKRRRNEKKGGYNEKYTNARRAQSVGYAIAKSLATKGPNKVKDWEGDARRQAGRAINRAMKGWVQRTYTIVTDEIARQLLETTAKIVR